MPSELAHFYSRTRAARKIIVVDLGFLGDTVHLIPALWQLKLAYPEAALHVLTTPVGVEVLRLAPCVDRAWGVELQHEKRTFRQQWKIVLALRRQHFDVAFNFSGADRTLFMTALTGARWRVAYPGGRSHFWNSWLIPNWIPRQDPHGLVFEQRRRMLAECGVPLSKPCWDLKVEDACSEWASKRVPPVAMHVSVSAAKETREWPLEHHAAMLQQVWSKHPELAVIATTGAQPRQQERLNKLSALVNDGRLQAWSEDLTIPRLAATLQRCRLHLGPDSGVLHLAVALEVPTVSFFREQGAYKSFLPSGPQHRVISMPCHCIDGKDAPCEKIGQGECFARIDPARVAGLVIETFEENPRR